MGNNLNNSQLESDDIILIWHSGDRAVNGACRPLVLTWHPVSQQWSLGLVIRLLQSMQAESGLDWEFIF